MQMFLFPDAERIGRQKLACCGRIFERISWPAWVALAAPYYEPPAGVDPVYCPLEVMLRIVLLQRYMGLSDAAMECLLKNQALVRDLVGLPEQECEVPDESSIMSVRRLLERHRLTDAALDPTVLSV